MRYSKQRELVRKAVRNNGCHPTADQIYKMVKKGSPSISLGTVYRNLNQLVEAGELLRVPVYGSRDCFDHNTHEHLHFRCEVCGTCVDLPEEDSRQIMRVLARTGRRTGMEIHSSALLLQGVCSACKEQGREEPIQPVSKT